MTFCLFFFITFFLLVVSSPIADRMLRQIFRRYNVSVNPYVALIESPLNGPVAFTATDGSRMFVDTRRLEEAPNTLWNVLRHEVAHTQGQIHSDVTPEMQYSVQLDPQGRIVNDEYRI